MYALSLKLSVIQTLYGIHSLLRIGHVYKGKILDDSTLSDRAVLLEHLSELFIEALLYVGYVEFHWALAVLPSAELNIDRPAVQLVQMKLTDGFGGRLAVFHMHKGIVLVFGTFGHSAILGKQSLHIILLSMLGEVSNENLHHCCSSVLGL